LVKGEKHRAKDEKKVISYRLSVIRDQGKQVKSEKKDGYQLSVIGYQGSEVTG
jgi:hypothetical protein